MYALYLTQNVIAINLNDILKIVSGQEKTPETRSFRGPSGEAQTGFEPVDTGVADHCLTTWLRRHMTPTGIEPVLPP